MHISEVLLTKDEVTSGDWRQLVLSLTKHIRDLRPFTLAVVFQENLIRYFVVSRHDLGQLSIAVDGLSLQPAKSDAQALLQKPERPGYFNLHLPAGASILEVKERYKVRHNFDIQRLYIDVIRLGASLYASMQVYGQGKTGYKLARKYIVAFPAHLLSVNYSTHTNYLRNSAPSYLDLSKTVHLLSNEKQGALFSVNAFPYFSRDYYLNLTSYEFDKHSFIMGSSGSGKSKLIQLYIDRLQQTAMAMNYRVVVIDPHAALEQDLRHISRSRVVNFGGEGAQLFPGAGTDISAATELTATLLLSMMGQSNARLERVMRFSLYALFVGQCMSLQMLKEFLTNLEVRTKILSHVSAYVPHNITHFFGADFNQIRTQHYNEALAPILSLVDEMELQPALVGDTDLSLAKTIQDNFLTVFSLNKVSMGEKVVKTVAGLLIQQIFLLAQARVFGQKVILIIDEVSVVQNPTLAAILAEARKFNLSVILTQQYFGQINKDLRDAILSNVVNYYVFKVSEEDARALEANLTIELPSELVTAGQAKGLKEPDLRAKLLTELDSRECIVRVSAGGQLLPAIRARTVDAPQPADIGVSADALLPYPQKTLPPKFSLHSPEPLGETVSELVEPERPSGPVRFDIKSLLARNSSSRKKQQ